jgi:hypothetical protein
MQRLHGWRANERCYELELYVPGESWSSPAFLARVEHGVRVQTVQLPGRLQRMLVALYLARCCDSAMGLEPSSAGWRSAVQLNGIIRRELGHDYQVEASSISRYMSMLARLVPPHKIQPGSCTPPLLERKRHLGYRLGGQIQLTIRRGGGETAPTTASAKNHTRPIGQSIRDLELMDVEPESARTIASPHTEATQRSRHKCRR